MSELRKAAEDALEALEQQRVFVVRPDHEGKEVTPRTVTNAITALKQALAEPEQELGQALKRAIERINELEAQRAELVEALREIEWSNDTTWQRDRAKAALAKVGDAAIRSRT